MSVHPCPDLEVLFAELEEGEGSALDHAADCAACSAILEEHRLMEQDLYRLADPLPPPTLVASVMARVATEPVPQRREVWSGLVILMSSLVGGLGVLVMSDQAMGRLGTGVASLLVEGRGFVEGLLSGARALWSTEGLAIAAILALLLLTSLAGLKRLAGSAPTPSEA
ncbi:hypothetical protein [Myxococcus stipitatus]|uniref:hypothetical protein n=1 Tax=Myxococcus stipitatus TaxID=83455 RepID=UPI0030D54E0A